MSNRSVFKLKASIVIAFFAGCSMVTVTDLNAQVKKNESTSISSKNKSVGKNTKGVKNSIYADEVIYDGNKVTNGIISVPVDSIRTVEFINTRVIQLDNYTYGKPKLNYTLLKLNSSKEPIDSIKLPWKHLTK
jgi:hypothetical protein